MAPPPWPRPNCCSAGCAASALMWKSSNLCPCVGACSARLPIWRAAIGGVARASSPAPSTVSHRATEIEALPVGGYRCAMNATLEQIAQEALRLAPAQRAELADFLLGSLDSTPPDEVQRLWLEEAARRLAEIRSGTVETIPSEDVLAEARRLIGR